MTEAELDIAYANLCRTMTHLGEAQMPLFDPDADDTGDA